MLKSPVGTMVRTKKDAVLVSSTEQEAIVYGAFALDAHELVLAAMVWTQLGCPCASLARELPLVAQLNIVVHEGHGEAV